MQGVQPEDEDKLTQEEYEAIRPFLEDIDEEIKDWKITKEYYHELQTKAATTVEYHALAGGKNLINGFITTLKDLRRTYKKKDLSKRPSTTDSPKKEKGE